MTLCSGLFSLTSRCASGPRQQSELLRGDRRRHGCGHRLLGQFPPDLELNKPLPCCTQSLPATFLLPATPPHTPQLICWAGPEGCALCRPKSSQLTPSSPLCWRPAHLWESTNSFYLSKWLFFFTQLLHRNKSKNLSVELSNQKFNKRALWKTEGKK